MKHRVYGTFQSNHLEEDERNKNSKIKNVLKRDGETQGWLNHMWNLR